MGIYFFLISLLAAGMPLSSQSCGKSWDFFSTMRGLMLTSSSNFMSSDCNHHHHVQHHHDHNHNHQDNLTSDGGIHLRLPLVHHARRLPLLTSFPPPEAIVEDRNTPTDERKTETETKTRTQTRITLDDFPSSPPSPHLGLL